MQLRRQGREREARTKERESIRRNARHLRDALACGGFATVGRGGWSLRTSETATLQGYGGTDYPVIAAAIRVGIPVIDTRTIPEDRIAAHALRGPMPGIRESRLCCSLGRCVGSEPCMKDHKGDGYRSLDTAPLAWWVPEAARIGATVYNFES